jgi:hypothetical protein
MRNESVQKAFDATGLNVYLDVYGFGRTKSVSFRLFRAAFNEARVRRVTKSCRREMQEGRVFGCLMYTQGDSISVRVRKATRRLRHLTDGLPITVNPYRVRT